MALYKHLYLYLYKHLYTIQDKYTYTHIYKFFEKLFLRKNKMLLKINR